MRKAVSFFIEQKESEDVVVAKEVYLQALMALRIAKKLHTAEKIRERYLSELLMETLKQLTAFFKKNQEHITNKGGEALLADLKDQLNNGALPPIILQVLHVNLERTQSWFFNREQIFAIFSTILALPCFQAQCLWRSAEHQNKQLQSDVTRLTQKTDEILSHTEQQVARTEVGSDYYQSLQQVKSILFAPSFKAEEQKKQSTMIPCITDIIRFSKD